MRLSPFSHPLRLSAVVLLVASCALPFGSTPTASKNADSQTESIKSTVGILKSNIATLKETIGPLLSIYNASGQSLTTPAHYRTLGSQGGNGTFVSWNDSDNQLASIVTPDTELAFAFSGMNAHDRSASIELKKSVDHTTGVFNLEVGSDEWQPMPTLAPDQNTLPYEIAYNELPNFDLITKLGGKMTIIPQGNENKRVSLEASAGTFAELSFLQTDEETKVEKIVPLKIPTHYALKVGIPKTSIEQTLDIKKGGANQAEFTLAGSLSFEVDAGRQDWSNRLVLILDDTTKSNSGGRGEFTFENKAQDFKLTGTLLPKGENTVVLFGKFTSKDGKELATLSFDQGAGDKQVSITYADGSKDFLN